MTPTPLIDLALAPIAGYLGTKAMEPVSTWLYERQSQADRDREDAARPGRPYRIAAQKSAALLGLTLSESALDKAALVFHYGLAVSWAPTYPLLRRGTGLGPVAAGLASGAAMSAIVDEGLTPALGFARRTAPSQPPRTCAASSRTWRSGSPSRPSPKQAGRSCGVARSTRPTAMPATDGNGLS